MLNSGRRSSNIMKSRFDCSSRGSLLIKAVSMKKKIVARKHSCLDNDLIVEAEVIRSKQWGFLEDEFPVNSTSSSPCSQAYDDDSASNAFSVRSLFEASIYVCSCIICSSLGTLEVVGRMRSNKQPVRSTEYKRVKHTPHTALLTAHSSQHTALSTQHTAHSTQHTAHTAQ